MTQSPSPNLRPGAAAHAQVTAPAAAAAPAAAGTAASAAPVLASPAGVPASVPDNPAAMPPAASPRPATMPPVAPYSYNARPSLLGTGLQRDILSLLIKVAVIAGIVAALFTFIFGVFQTTSPSMAPAVNSGDLILYSRFDRQYAAQDLVVVSYRGEMQVRRVVATQGDTVDISDGRLIVNGAVQQEANIFTTTNRYESEISFPLTVAEGHIFVLGDNREGSTDSRIYGTVDQSDTLGKVTGLFRRRGL